MQIWPVHDRAGPQPAIAHSLPEQSARGWPDRTPARTIRLGERRCGCDRVRLDLADADAWPNLRLHPAAAEPPAAQPRAYPVLPPAAAEPVLHGSLRRQVLAESVLYRKKPAVVGRARAPLPPSPALSCGASSARSSICASLACNTPTASRATQANQAGQRSRL